MSEFLRLRSTAAFLAVALATACGGAADSGRSVQRDTGGIAVVALQADLDAMNVLVTGDRYTQEVLRYLLFLPLVQYDSALNYQPALAESFDLEGDSAVTFRLRRDVFWHDGAHTTAHDVAFTWQRAADTATAFPNADWLIGWGTPQVVDSFTVRFPLQRMADPLAGVALFPIMPRHLLDSIPAARLREAPFNRKPVGNGPFRFLEYLANDRWVFTANHDFPESLGGRPPLSRIVLRIIPDGTAQVAELRAGQVDLGTNIPVDQLQQLAADSLLRAIVRPSRNYAFIPWNGKRPPLDDARVRKALALAIDRQEIITVLRAGQGEVPAGPIGRFHWAFNADLPPLPFSTDSARALLARAGLRDRDGDGMLEQADGARWQIELRIPASSSMARGVAEMVQADLKDAGVRLTIRPIEYNTLSADLQNPARPFDAVIIGWENDLRLNLHDMFHSAALSGPFQFGSFRNTEFDSLIERASAEPSREVATPLWHRAQEILREEQPWTFLYTMPDLYVARETLRDAAMDIRGAFVNAPRWWKDR